MIEVLVNEDDHTINHRTKAWKKRNIPSALTKDVQIFQWNLLA